METKIRNIEYIPERVVIFIDYHNLEITLRNQGYKTNLIELKNYLSEGRWLDEIFCYVGTNPNNLSQSEQFIHHLRSNGFIVRTKMAKVINGNSLKCDMDMIMALDILDYSEASRPDIVVIVSGDGDFAPIAERLRLKGIRVEVASIPGAISGELKEIANGFIDLTEALIEETQEISESMNNTEEEVKNNGSGNYQRQEGEHPGESDNGAD